MRRLLLLSALIMASAALVLLHQPFSGDTTLATHTSTAGTVDHVALDTDQTGNAPPGAGTIASPYACFTSGGIKVPATTTVQTTVSQPTIGSTVKIDVVVDQIDISDRVQSYQFVVNYPDQGNALGTAATVLSGGPPSFIPLPMIAANDISNPTPAGAGYVNATSEVKISVSDAGNTPGECGSGVLATLTFKCLKPGTVDLTLSAVILVPDGGISGSNLVDGAGTGTTTLGGATVTCGSQFDPEALTAVTAAPASATLPATFDVTVDGTVKNNGPTQPANTDVKVTLNKSNDCTVNSVAPTTAGPTVTGTNPAIIQDQSLTATASAIPQLTFSVSCTQHSNHSFTATIETILDDTSGGDTDSGNNTATSAASVTTVSGAGDANITAESTTDNLVDNDNALSGLCVVTGATNVTCTIPDAELLKNQTRTVTINKDVTLVSKASAAPVDYTLATAATAPAGCSATPVGSVSTPLSFSAPGALSASHTFDIVCTVAGTSPTFQKTWTFDNTLTPAQHVTDGRETSQITLTTPVIEKVAPTLKVIKTVVNNNVGTAVASDFTMTVTAANPSPASFPGDAGGTIVTLDAGTYSVSETGPNGYTESQSADCSGTIAAGQTKTCTITNDDIPPVVNDISVSLDKDEIIGDDNPSGDRIHTGILTSRTINVVVTNSAVPATIDVSLSAIFEGTTSPPECAVQWFAGSFDTTGNLTISTDGFSTGPMAVAEIKTFPVALGIVCDAPVNLSTPLQIVANVDSIEDDPDTINNQAENKVAVLAKEDWDNDNQPTPDDNCPDTPNPDQSDFDGDEIGDACDPDGDDDGVLNDTDDCPFLAEDPDGIQTEDGCPDTDVSVNADKDESVVLSVPSTVTKTVNLTITNGNYGPTDVLVHLLAVSSVGQCEVTLQPLQTDSVQNSTTDEDGDGFNETRRSLLEWKETQLDAFEVRVSSRDYDIECLVPGAFSFELQFDAAPLPPIIEEEAANNVHKNFPTVLVETAGPPTLTVIKACDPPTDPGKFNLKIDAITHAADALCGGTTGAVVVSTGAHTVSETAGTGNDLANYTTAITGACATNGSVTLTAGQNLTCTITNTKLPTLKVDKVCVPSTVPGKFNLKIDAITQAADALCGGTTGAVVVSTGAHTVSETAGTGNDLANYTTAITGACATNGSVTLTAGQNLTCTITNTSSCFITSQISGSTSRIVSSQSTLCVFKVIVNTGGGTAGFPDFQQHVLDNTNVDVSGSPFSDDGSGTTFTLAPGNYKVSEDGEPGYTTTFSGDCDPSGNVSLVVGTLNSCTVTNTFVPPTLTVTKVIVNTGGGTAGFPDFQQHVLDNTNVDVSGSPFSDDGSGTPFTLAPGNYKVSEDGEPGYTTTFSGDCDASGNVTLAGGNLKGCTVTNTFVPPTPTPSPTPAALGVSGLPPTGSSPIDSINTGLLIVLGVLLSAFSLAGFVAHRRAKRRSD